MIPPHNLGVKKGVGMTFWYSYECRETGIHSVQLRSILHKQIENYTFHKSNLSTCEPATKMEGFCLCFVRLSHTPIVPPETSRELMNFLRRQ
jgi:hypothetical protein